MRLPTAEYIVHVIPTETLLSLHTLSLDAKKQENLNIIIIIPQTASNPFSKSYKQNPSIYFLIRDQLSKKDSHNQVHRTIL